MKNLALLLMSFWVLSLSSCGGGQGTQSNSIDPNQLKGTWVLVSVSGTPGVKMEGRYVAVDDAKNGATGQNLYRKYLIFDGQTVATRSVLRGDSPQSRPFLARGYKVEGSNLIIDNEAPATVAFQDPDTLVITKGSRVFTYKKTTLSEAAEVESPSE